MTGRDRRLTLDRARGRQETYLRQGQEETRDSRKALQPETEKTYPGQRQGETGDSP